MSSSQGKAVPQHKGKSKSSGDAEVPFTCVQKAVSSLRNYANNASRAFVGSEAVTILVGEEQKKFFVHKKLICHYSGFFRGALEGNFAEAEDNVVELEDDHPDLFALFVTWLYTKHINLTINASEAQIPLPPAVSENYSEVAVRLWVLADKLQARRFGNAVISELYRMLTGPKGTVQYAALVYTWSHTTDNAKLRKLLVEYFARGVNLGKIGGHNEPADFLVELVKRMYELRQQPDGMLFRDLNVQQFRN